MNAINNLNVNIDLTDEQIKQIASLAIQEQGTLKGTLAEVSLMANLFELRDTSSYREGGEGLYNYIKNSGWWASAADFMADTSKVDEETFNAVKEVLVGGKRTLPGYVDEHDCLSDILVNKYVMK